ncbi:MAG: DUF309 domain-containing protein [Arenicellales bacterium]
MTRSFTLLADDRFGLPPGRHIPGSGSVPCLDFLRPINEHCPFKVESENWGDNVAYRYGWFLFLNAYYWESHEIWETVWMRCAVNSKERLLLKGIIQLANSRLKAVQGKNNAAQKILIQSRELIEEAFRGSPETDSGSIMGVKQYDLLELNQDYAL